MCQGSWIRFSTVTGLFSRLSRVTGWCLLRKVFKQASSLYLCIFKNVFEKARKTSEKGSILWKLQDYRPKLKFNQGRLKRPWFNRLNYVKFNTDALLEICRSCWLQHYKIKKKLQRRDEWKLRFKQLQLNYINNYQKQKREDIKLVTVSSGVDVVVKIDDEVYVLSIIKLYCYFSFVFCCAKEGRVAENNQSNVATFKILR